MAGIIKRTILMDDSDGYCRPLDFNRVVTGIGTMWEPSSAVFLRSALLNDAAAYECDDQISMVNAIERVSLDSAYRISGEWVGGTLAPRSGR